MQLVYERFSAGGNRSASVNATCSVNQTLMNTFLITLPDNTNVGPYCGWKKPNVSVIPNGSIIKFNIFATDNVGVSIQVIFLGKLENKCYNSIYILLKF